MERIDRVLIGAAALALTLAGCGDAPPAKEVKAVFVPEFIPLGGQNTWAMITPQGSDPAKFKGWAKDRCGGAEFCKVFAWPTRDSAARALPMTDRELEAQLFSYGVNRNTGYDEALWDCDRFPKLEGTNCA